MNIYEDTLTLVVTIDPHRIGLDKLCPQSELRIGRWKILINPKGAVEAEFWIVFGNARPKDQIKIGPENTMLVVLEPNSKKVYPKKYYRQFEKLVDTHTESGHPNVVLCAPRFCWHVGLKLEDDCYTLGYKELSHLDCPKDRKNKISVICSDAMRTEGQRERLLFLDGLKKQLGDRIDHYGRGFQPIDDKMDGILGYRLHLALENCRAKHYWSEKLIDSYLGWAFAVYVGCPNILDYFPKNSVDLIDSMDPIRASDMILERLEQPTSEAELAGLNKGRDLVLNQYNPFNCWASWAEMYFQKDCQKTWFTIECHKAFRPYLQGALFRLRNIGNQTTGLNLRGK